MINQREVSPKSVYLESLGCKLNQAEVEAWARQLAAMGYAFAPCPEAADLHIINTCAVTHVAERKSRQLIRQARRRRPGALVVAAGCFIDRAAGEAMSLGASVALGNEDKEHLVELIGPAQNAFPTRPPWLRTRALVWIQQGCDQGCSYCIVPQLRGRARSRSAAEVLAEVQARERDGYREVVLTGNQLGSYRDGYDLAGLVRRILGETDIERIRISSLQPQDITPELLHLWATQSRLCRHLHLPLQSGSEAVLRRMGRRYSPDDYWRALGALRQAVPEMAITTDVMVGFPAESPAEFEESLRFCARAAFANMHVFPFSPRPGTAAARFPAQVDAPTKKERSQAMLALAEELARSYRSRFLGCTLPVLWEARKPGKGRDGGGAWVGLSDNYLRVYCHAEADLRNQLLPCRPTALAADGLWADGPAPGGGNESLQ